MALLIAVAIFIVVFCYSWMNKKPKKFPPGPLCWPLLGSVLSVPRKYPHLIMAGSWLQKYGPVVGLMFGSRKVIAVSGSKAVLEALLRDEFQGRTESFRLKETSFNKRLGVIFTDGPYWLEMKRFIVRNLKNFGFGRKSMEDLIMQEVDDLIKELRSKETVQVYGLFKISALNVLWGMMSGTRYARDNEEVQIIIHDMDRVFRSGTKSRGISDVYPALKRVFPRITGFQEFKDSIKNIQSLMKRTIREHKQDLDENNPRDFIDTYLTEIKKKKTNGKSIFTEEGLIVTCQDLFAAGGDTTNNTLAFCLLYMVLHPDVQNEIQKELDSVVGRNRRPSIGDKHRLHYVNAVLTEVTRINPAVPLTIPHRVVKDTNLNGYEIPKDTLVFVNLWSLFHDREHWGDPEVFRPERFLDGNKNVVMDEWMIPFGAGKRVCLGEVLARSTVFLFFTTLLQEFTFSVPEDDPVPQTLPLPGMTMAPQPFKMKIARRI